MRKVATTLVIALAPLGSSLATALLVCPEVALASDEEEECLDCHEDDDSTITFKDGAEREVLVDPDIFVASVHGGQRCDACHPGMDEHTHTEVRAETSRAYTVEQSKACTRCHYDHGARALDGVHYEALAAGNAGAPVCVDCHGSHGISRPDEPRGGISQRCARCHASVYAEYAESVHGRALAGEGSPDLPVCTDCHGSHAIFDPNSKAARTRSHEICARCHGDAARMERYGLNPDVVVTYLDDFHGVSNALYAKGLGTPKKPMATCTDCHGVHAIRPFESGESPAAMKQKLAELCGRCHEGATPSFGDAWLSHYKPTLESAPLVWGVRTAYSILIPAIVAGLLLHIFVHSVHLWRVSRRRKTNAAAGSEVQDG